MAANQVLAGVRAMFGFALDQGIIDASPVARVKPPGEKTARDRVLSAGEIRVVWAAAGDMGYPFGDFFRLLLITGQRRVEVARMRWADVDFDAALWTLPAAATKAGRANIVPLSPLALEILRAAPRTRSPFVLTTRGITAIAGFSSAKVRIDGLDCQSPRR